MKIFATVFAGLIAAASAQTAATTNASTNASANATVYVESIVQTKDLIANGVMHGTLAWRTRAVAGSPDLSDIVYQFYPTNNNGSAFVSQGLNDKLVEIAVGPISPRANATANITGFDRADYCRFRVQLKEAPEAPWRNVIQDTKDGRLDGFFARGANDKWNFDEDAADRQNCRFTADTLFNANFNKTQGNIRPVFTWSKLLNTKDTTQDIPLAFGDSPQVYWRFKLADLERRGFIDGMFLDDPLNSVLVTGGAKALFAGVLSSAALVYAILA